jgi:hypothetical protein
MSSKIEINMDLIKAIGAIPLTLRNGPFGRCLGEFAKPIARATEPLSRSSRESGSRNRWSRKYKNNPAFSNDSRKHIGHKVGKSGVAVWIGAQYPKGNKQQFVMPYKKGTTYTRNLWGKKGQKVLRTSRRGNQYYATVGADPQTANFPNNERAPVRAYDQTRTQAEAAFLDQLQKEIKELRIG